MITIKNLQISSIPVEKNKGICVFSFTRPVMFINCTFDECAKNYVNDNPHLFGVI